MYDYLKSVCCHSFSNSIIVSAIGKIYASAAKIRKLHVSCASAALLSATRQNAQTRPNSYSRKTLILILKVIYKICICHPMDQLITIQFKILFLITWLYYAPLVWKQYWKIAKRIFNTVVCNYSFVRAIGKYKESVCILTRTVQRCWLLFCFLGWGWLKGFVCW